jgi:hypothetical protein
MNTISISILASCLALYLGCVFGLADSSILDTLILWDLIFVPFLAAAIFGLVIGFAIAKLLGQAMPFVTEVTETFQLSFKRGDSLEDDFYCVKADLASGKKAFHVYSVSDNNLRLVKSLWENDTTVVVPDQTLSDTGIWNKTRMVPDPSSSLYHWALAQPKDWRNELHLPPDMVEQNP